jgi:hypothetical protein
MRLRRDSDNAETEVYPDSSGYLSLTSPTGTRTGPSLSSWLGSNNAYMAAWWCQSRLVASVMADTAKQLLVASAGVIPIVDGVPGIRVTQGRGDYSTGLTLDNESFSAFIRLKTGGVAQRGAVLGAASTPSYNTLWLGIESSSMGYKGDGSSYSTIGVGGGQTYDSSANYTSSMGVSSGSTGVVAWQNGSDSRLDAPVGGQSTWSVTLLPQDYRALDGHIFEIAIYDASKHSSGADITSNQFTFAAVPEESFTSFDTEVLNDSPISYWHFKEGAGSPAFEDVSGGISVTREGLLRDHGSFYPGVPAWRGGGTVALNNGHMKVGATAPLNPSNVRSIEAIVQRASTRAPLTVYHVRGDSNKGMGASITESGDVKFSAYGIADYFAGVTVVSDTLPHHLVITRASNGNGTDTVKIYLDGTLKSTLTTTEPVDPVGAQLRIGATSNNDGTLSGSLPGSVGALALYSTALSDAQVAAHYATLDLSQIRFTRTFDADLTGTVPADFTALGSPTLGNGNTEIVAKWHALQKERAFALHKTTSNVLHGYGVSGSSDPDQEVTVLMEGSALSADGRGAGAVLQGDAGSQKAYLLALSLDTVTVDEAQVQKEVLYISKYNGSFSTPTDLKFVEFEWDETKTYWFRFRIESNGYLRGKVWEYNTAEPLTWTIGVEDASPLTGGLAGFGSGTNHTQKRHVWYVGTATKGATAPSIESTLDSIVGMEPVYSVRRAIAEYQGPLLRGSRLSDSAEVDIYPDSRGWLSANSPTGSANGTTTLSAWAGSSVVKCRKWFDQRAGADASGTVNSDVPEIWDGTGVHVKNGATTLRFANDWLTTTANVKLTEVTAYAGYKNIGSSGILIGTAGNANSYLGFKNSETVLYTYLQSNGGAISYEPPPHDSLEVLSFAWGLSAGCARYGGSNIVVRGGSGDWNGFAWNAPLLLGRRLGNSELNGWASEYVVATATRTASERAVIEANVLAAHSPIVSGTWVYDINGAATGSWSASNPIPGWDLIAKGNYGWTVGNSTIAQLAGAKAAGMSADSTYGYRIASKVFGTGYRDQSVYMRLAYSDVDWDMGGAIVRTTGGGSGGYTLGPSTRNGNKLTLNYVSDLVNPTILDSIAFDSVVGQVVHLRLEAVGSKIRGKMWFDGQSEPSDWQVSATDTRSLSGLPGYFTRPGYDKIEVTDFSVAYNGAIALNDDVVMANQGSRILSGGAFRVQYAMSGGLWKPIKVLSSGAWK